MITKHIDLIISGVLSGQTLSTFVDLARLVMVVRVGK